MDETKPSGVEREGNGGERGNETARTRGGNGVTRRSVLIGVGILAISLAAQACITFFGTLRKGRSASITDSDGVVREMPLDTNGRAEVTTALGTNIIEVADGQIRVVDATCTNKDCVHQGPISRPGQTIVCLPNRLVIRIEGSDDGDDGGNGGGSGNEGGGNGDTGSGTGNGSGGTGGTGGTGNEGGGTGTGEDSPPDVDAVAG
jgi:hypothetical protein